MIIWKHKPNTPKATEIEKHTSKKKKKKFETLDVETQTPIQTHTKV